MKKTTRKLTNVLDFIGKSTKVLGVLFVIAVFVIISTQKTLADDDHDYGGSEHESESHENEHEAYSGHESDDDKWDFSDDFRYEPQVYEQVIQEQIPAPIIVDAANETANLTVNQTIDLTLFDDDDGDGVINKDDTYPGQNDALYIDSDGDGIVNFYDQYPGLDDKYFETNQSNVTAQEEIKIKQEEAGLLLKFLKLLGFA